MKNEVIRVRVPALASIEYAIRLYYERIEISTKDIRKLFGNIGGERALKLKKLGKKQMEEDGVPTWNSACVNTASAYKAWGLDIGDLEKRHAKLSRLDAKKAQGGA